MAGQIRQPIDIASLSNYLSTHATRIKLPIRLKQFSFGQSNPSYEVTAADGRRYVLRKKPPGKLLSRTAHQIEREYRVLHALAPTDVPVPETYALCEDAAVVGTPFYIMEFLDGRIFEDAWFPGVTAEEREEMWHDAIRCIAKLHCVDFAGVGLSNFSKTVGFYDRQLRTLSAVSASQSTVVDVETHTPVGPIPHFEEMVDFFRHTQPPDRATLVHGDYKIDNLVYHPTEPRVIGILDWEMSAIGHPISDLSNLLHQYTFASSSNSHSLISSTSNIRKFSPDRAFSSSASDGLPSRETCLKWYAEAAGWDPVPMMAWGDAFSVFRNSVIVQGIAARLALGQTSSAQAKQHAMRMEPYGEFAWSLVQHVKNGDGVGVKL